MKKDTFFLLLFSLFNLLYIFPLHAQQCQQVPGQADSYVLALSWEPGFCQTHGYEVGKPECLVLKDDSFASQNLVLHGLWPNQKACGTNYGYCGVEPQKNHCDYAEVKLSEKVGQALKRIMPSYAHGSCLERHEWNKHGSCQLLSSDDYFELSGQLAQEINASPLQQFLQENRGKSVEFAQLRRVIAQAFGERMAKKINLGCTDGMLVDVYFLLPEDLVKDESVYQLLQRVKGSGNGDSCPNKVKISNFVA